MRVICCFILIVCSGFVYAQQSGEEAEKFLESQAGTETEEIETEELSQKLEWYKFHKVDINKVTELFLAEELHIPADLCRQFILYRKLAGPFIDILELQAIPGWEPELIRSLLPYITADRNEELLPAFKQRVRSGKQFIQIRTGWVGEKQAGYVSDAAGMKSFQGNRLKTLVRYSFRSGSLLQWSITAEKDAGEKMFSKNNVGFDFYSWQLSVGSVGRLQSLVIGDFNINMGQGLIHWQSAGAMHKNAETILILRQGRSVRPHSGSGEHFFHRGVAASVKIGQADLLLFAAKDRWDSRIESDTSEKDNQFIGSIQTSGLHRSISELRNKNSLGVLCGGGVLSFSKPKFHMAVNGIHYQLQHPIRRENLPEYLYAINGRSWTNVSLNYRFNIKGLYLFGEMATDSRKSIAAVTGLISAVHPNLSLSLLARFIPPSFRSFQGNAFTEQTEPNNEQGLYMGGSYSPHSRLRINVYADIFRFPWLRSQISAPSSGASEFLEFGWKPDKRHEFVIRLQHESKMTNAAGGQFIEKRTLSVNRFQLRFQQKISGKSLDVMFRIDMTGSKKESGEPENGYLFLTDLNLHPAKKKWQWSARICRFSNTGFGSRLYAMEKNVRNYHSLTMLDGDGWRGYLILNYKISKYILFSSRASLSYYIESQTVGSGDGLSDRPYRTDYHLQLFYFF